MSIVLTKNPISDVLRYGEADNSPLACKLISRISEKLGIDVIACYSKAHFRIDLPVGCDLQKLVESKRIKFVDELMLSFFIHGGRSRAFDEVLLRDELYKLFSEVIADENITLSFDRDYIPEEMAYYGWNNTPRSRWDMSLVIQGSPAEAMSYSVNVEYIDRLAFWNYLHDAKEPLNKSALLSKYGAKAFPGYDEKRMTEVCYVVFSEYTLAQLDRAAFEKEFSELLSYLIGKRDVWDTVTPERMTPVLTTWDRLTLELKFAFSKG